MKIGVFDSGAGGRSVAHAIKKAFPNDEIVYRQDRKNVPYGLKQPDELFRLVLPILSDMQDAGCRVVVVACNTVTTTIIERLRKELNVPLVGIEPMVKPAAQLTSSKVVAVCATPATLKSARYKHLKATYAKHITVLEPDCSDWAQMIERDEIDQERIKTIVDECLAQGADVFVMGCTHYHWIEEKIAKLAGEQSAVIQPEQAIISQLGRVLKQLV